MPKTATDISSINKDTLPNLSAQIYENGNDRRIYFNVNDTISYISLTSPTSDTSATNIPSGIICMWSGTIATIPTGWNLCNGSNGTPDLRNRFIVCADADVSGVAKSTVTGSAAQSGDGQLPATTTATEAAHTHTLPLWYSATGPAHPPVTLGSAVGEIAYTSDAGSAHSHTFGTGTVNVAVFYALAYIMKS